MKGWMALVMLAAVVAYLPAAQAHDCNGYDCGPCTKGEYHNHNDWGRGQCTSGEAWHARNGHGGQSVEVPGHGALAATLSLVGTALVARRP